MFEEKLEYKPYGSKQSGQVESVVKRLSTPHLDSLINRSPSHLIKNIKPFDKNLELKFIVLSKNSSIKTKQGAIITSLLVADSSGAIQMNVFDEYGSYLNESDVCYVQNAYAGMYKDRLILYQGKQGILKHLTDYFFDFVPKPNFSDKNWSDFLTSKQGQLNSQ